MIALLLALLAGPALGQDEYAFEQDLWLANRVVGGGDRWKVSGLLETRLSENYRTLSQWYLEGAVSYMPTKHLELTGDYRFTVKPSLIENRFGWGVVFKITTKPLQFVNQVKYQIDLPYKVAGTIGHGLREVVFLTVTANKTVLPGFVVGTLYRWHPNYTGVEFVRFGPNLAVRPDPKLAVVGGYYLGWAGVDDSWHAFLSFTLVFTLNKEFRYVPAIYRDF